LIPPGSTIGILGGGQLGRMLAMAAAQLGYRVHIYSPERESIAAEVSHAFTCADWHDVEALAKFAADCAVVTYEFENVPTASLHEMGEVRFFPHPRALETAQDRFSEKTFVEGLGGTIAPIATVDSKADFANAVAKIGTPGILKTRRDGYDGKGQWRVENGGQALSLDLPDQPMVYEAFVRFQGEFSVILCRGIDGEILFWDTPQNTHIDGILTRSNVPAAPYIQSQVTKARQLAEKVAGAMGYVGVLTLEFFATAEGPVFNEMAPRVHNSGHWTIEGAVTSQFENHIRAICGLPLGKVGMAAESVEMHNLIGLAADDWATLLGDPANRLHLYGKGEAREGRKMGHVTKLTLL
jgi:5-(carboxyamino)imidazole ribonucleotide synthase